MAYDFGEQLSWGERVEALLDAQYAPDYEIQHVSLAEDRRGTDRVYIHHTTKRTFRVQYKDDRYRTGNFFIETVSNDVTRTPGWVYTTDAPILIYHWTNENRTFILRMQYVRRMIQQNDEYRKVSVLNKGYQTHGLLVPRRDLEPYTISDADFRNARLIPATARAGCSMRHAHFGRGVIQSFDADQDAVVVDFSGRLRRLHVPWCIGRGFL